MNLTILFRLAQFCLIFLLILVSSPSLADTTVGGTIDADTVWSLSGSPYIVTSTITVKGTDGADGITTLTIEPGVTVKFNQYQRMNIGASSGDPGALVAQGEAGNPILFTSNKATPAPGDWYFIQFNNTTDDATTVMEHCIVEYGGYSNGSLYLYQASPTIRNVTVQNSKSYGINSSTSEPIIENCTFAANQNYDLFYSGTTGGSVTGCTINSGISLLASGTVNFSGNTIHQNNSFPIKAYADMVGSIVSGSSIVDADADSYLEVSAGTISRDATWTAAIPYAVIGTITVKGTDGADGITTLTIEPGVTVKFNQYQRMNIGASSGDPGALVAQGEAGNPILFTSNKATPAPGDWYFIQFNNTTDDATTVMEHCIVEYGGYSNGSLYLYQASPTIRNVTVQNSKSYGINSSTSEPIIENCTFAANQNYDLFYSGTTGGSVTGCTINSGISLLASGTVNFSGNTIHQNNSFPIKAYADMVGSIVSGSSIVDADADSYLEVSAGTISRDATWTAAIPYAVIGTITVKGTDGADGITTLTIEPGVTVKFNQYQRMNIGASSGDPGALVAQGDAGNPILFTSNKATPAPGDWYYIEFYNTTDDATTVMEHCTVEYGGYSSGSLYLYQASPRIVNNTIRYSNTAGIYGAGSGTSSATIACNNLIGNQNGVYWTVSPPPDMNSNNFNGNTNYGLYYSGSELLNAENNWWGDSAGPNQSGDATYGNVDADPWATEEVQCVASGENQPPYEPSNPTPADTAVRVSITNGADLSWNGGDPDLTDMVTYDLYWGASAESLQLAEPDLTQVSHTKAGLDAGVTYYWNVVAKDDKGAATTGPVWSFTTDGDPPDLTVSQVTTSPAGNLQAGQSVTFIAQIGNIGSGPMVDSFTVNFLLDGVSIGTATVDQIMYTGGTVEVEQAWTFSGGNPSIEVSVDSQGQVSETDETNNSYFAVLSAIADNAAPTLINTSPIDGAQLQEIQMLSVALADAQSDVDDSIVISSYTVVDSSQQTITGTVTESGDIFTFVPGSLPLSDDTYQVSFTAADSCGNSAQYSFAFTIDTQPPDKPVITGGTVDSGTIQARPTENIASQFVVELTGTRESGTALWINAVATVGAEDVDWITSLTLSPGNNTFEVWLTDEAGNQSESEWVDIYINTATGISYEYNDSGRLTNATSN